MDHKAVNPLDATLAAIIGLLAVQRKQEAAELAVKNRVMVSVILKLDCTDPQPNVRGTLEFGMGFLPQNDEGDVAKLFTALPDNVVDHVALCLDYATDGEVQEANETAKLFSV